MSIIIDRRKNTSGKSINNRQKFLKRIEGQIKKALPDIIGSEKITDSKNGGAVKVPVKGMKEPAFRHDPATGDKNIVRPGNDRFAEGDRVPKPEGGGGGSGKGKGSNQPGTTEDEFSVILSREEFLKYFFDDLELPNLIKEFLESTEKYKNRRSGYIKDGVPSRLNIQSSYRQALGRKIALHGVFEQRLKDLKEQLEKEKDPKKKEKLKEEIELAKNQLATIPFFEDLDLRYNNFEQVPLPATSAVMFCIMDVSGSMGFHEKDISKRFFTLLYLFLTQQYDKVEMVFIRHHTEAKEVDEEEFFNSRESGGTIVAPSLKLMKKIINERYNDHQWNIYCCQASDGDVWGDADAIECQNLIKEEILPAIQYMAYIEINESERSSSLWDAYQVLQDEDKFSMRNIFEVNEIWPVFKGLFRKRNVSK
ncbi:YeaH/YhbH family protein [Cytophagaceae bacterium ABcell3]|nr:YeaH/YhbH family protein [Cytophagaceae bacterium ABcell3]